MALAAMQKNHFLKVSFFFRFSEDEKSRFFLIFYFCIA